MSGTTTHPPTETTRPPMQGVFILTLGVGLLALESRSPKAARWGIGLLALYVALRSRRARSH